MSSASTRRLRVLPAILQPTVLGALLLAVPSASAQVSFSPRTDIDVNPRPKGIVAGDMNQDGHLDLVTANQITNEVTVLLNDGVGSFTPQAFGPVASSGEWQPLDVDLGDLDGDGDLDVAIPCWDTANWSFQTVLMQNDGAGNLAPAAAYPCDRPSDVVCVDLDGVGGLDFAVCNQYVGPWCTGETVTVFLNGGSGLASFTSGVSYPVGCAPWAIAAGDLDGDGDNDLVVANDQSADVAVLLNDGSGGFAPAIYSPAGDVPNDVVCCDLDGDSDLDLVVGHRTGDGIRVLWNNGTASFSPPSIYPPSRTTQGVACADFDCDGLPDLVGAHADGTLSVLLNLGGQAFDVPLSFPIDVGSQSVLIANLDDNVSPDIATANGNASSHTVSVLLNEDVNPCCPTEIGTDTITYKILGPGNEVDWSWCIRSTDGSFADISGTVAGVNGTSHDVALAFADSITTQAAASGCDVVDATATQIGNSSNGRLEIDLGGTTNFILEVGPAGTPCGDPVMCQVGPTDGPCSFNPTIAQIVASGADCNANGFDDAEDVAFGVSPDADGNGIPDECEPDPCAADLDGSGDVGFADLTALLGAWGPCGTGPCPADLDGDGQVAFADLTTLLGLWGPCN